MDFNINYNNDSVDPLKWSDRSNNQNLFINYNFLKLFSKFHPSINHLFIQNGKNRIFANIFTINIKGLKGYSINKLYSFLISFFEFKFLYLTNAFITNVRSYSITEPLNLDSLISKISIDNKINFVVVPDVLYESLDHSNKNYIKIEVEEDMFLSLDSSWDDFESYKLSLKTKYRKKIKSIFNKSKNVEIRELSKIDLTNYKSEIQILFNNVIKSNKFQGPTFNTETFADLIKEYESFKVFGYFLNDDLVAFASEFSHIDNHYSYYIGLNYEFNRKFALYERILCEAIKNAIELKKNSLILGRTANEFKSNFGAVPKKSFIYLKIQNVILNFLLKPFLVTIKPKDWVQRFPFKKS